MEDVPSDISFKDQGLTIQALRRGERVAVSRIPARCSGREQQSAASDGNDNNGELPSDLDYEDQALSIEDLCHRGNTKDTIEGPVVVQSNLDEDPQQIASTDVENDHANTAVNSIENVNDENTLQVPVVHAIPIVDDDEEAARHARICPMNDSHPQDNGNDTVKFWKTATVTVFLFLLLAVGLAVGLGVGLSSSSSSSSSSSKDNLPTNPPTPTPTPWVSTQDPTPSPPGRLQIKDIRYSFCPPCVCSFLFLFLSRETTVPPPREWQQVGQDLNGEAEGDWFGCSVSLSADGTIVAAGGYRNDGADQGINLGHVRVYQYNNNGTWIQMGQDLDGEADADYFGWEVVLSADGKTVAGGAPNNDGVGHNAGHVRVYTFDESLNTWLQLGEDLDGGDAGDDFGSAVSLSADGRTIAAGGWMNNGNGKESGFVRVHRYDNERKTWLQLGKHLYGEAAGDRFGRSVALSADGHILAAGGLENDVKGSSSGRVRIYQYNSETNVWLQLGQDLDGASAGDKFGVSVSLCNDGHTVAAGSLDSDGNGNNSGHVRIYQLKENTNTWLQLGQDLDGEWPYDNFGISVSLSADGRVVAAGAWLNDGSTGMDSGHVRIYSYSYRTEIWEQIGADVDGEFAGDSFGVSVSLSANGNTVAAGAWLNDGNGTESGHVRVFESIIIA